jgi:hypothetical protein
MLQIKPFTSLIRLTEIVPYRKIKIYVALQHPAPRIPHLFLVSKLKINKNRKHPGDSLGVDAEGIGT